MHDEFAKIDEAIQALGEGRVIIVVDDEDRENEGDFVAAAEKVTPETIAFMIRGGGQLCMPILPEIAARLQLGPMVDHNTTPHQTQYTVPVDHVSCRTGISAEERARTVRAIIDPRPSPKTWSVLATCSPGCQGGRRPPSRGAYRGGGGSGPHGRIDSGGCHLRDPRWHQYGR